VREDRHVSLESRNGLEAAGAAPGPASGLRFGRKQPSIHMQIRIRVISPVTLSQELVLTDLNPGAASLVILNPDSRD
jgi:hypothetical protein